MSLSRKLQSTTTKYIASVFTSENTKKFSFSKVLAIATTVTTIAVTIYACVAMWYFNNIDPLSVVIPAVFAECATVTGFYSYKAKAENEIKLDTQRKLITLLLEQQTGKDIDEETHFFG